MTLGNEEHSLFACRCSFCKEERNLYNRLKKIAYPDKYKKYHYPYRNTHVISLRNYVK